MSQIDKDLFLENGGLLKLSEAIWWVGWGRGYKKQKPSPHEINLYISDFQGKKAFWWEPSYKALLTSEELQKEFSSWKKTKTSGKRSWQPPSYEKFSKDFEESLSSLEKGVPVFFEKSPEPFSREEKKKALTKLLQSQPHKYAYGFWTPEEGFMGVSPEVLFKVEDKTLETMALAGTGRNKEELLKDPKEKKEHLFVVQFLEDTLSELGRVEKSNLTLKPMEGFFHLQTSFKVLLEKPLLWDTLIQKLHPTPALGGVPRRKALAFLKKQESKRKNFGGPMGIWDPQNKKGFCIVAIRNFRWSFEGLEIGSGCGLIEQSEKKKEWKELELKRSWVKGFFNL